MVVCFKIESVRTLGLSLHHRGAASHRSAGTRLDQAGQSDGALSAGGSPWKLVLSSVTQMSLT